MKPRRWGVGEMETEEQKPAREAGCPRNPRATGNFIPTMLSLERMGIWESNASVQMLPATCWSL